MLGDSCAVCLSCKPEPGAERSWREPTEGALKVAEGRGRRLPGSQGREPEWPEPRPPGQCPHGAGPEDALLAGCRAWAQPGASALTAAPGPQAHTLSRSAATAASRVTLLGRPRAPRVWGAYQAETER